MAFKKIDLQNWKRKEYFTHYFTDVPCTYSMTVTLDVSRLYDTVKRNGLRLYPVLIYCLSHVVNNHEEFKMGVDAQGNIGVYDFVNPSYTVFHKETETFSEIWTAYHPDATVFYQNYEEDLITCRRSLPLVKSLQQTGTERCRYPFSFITQCVTVTMPPVWQTNYSN